MSTTARPFRLAITLLIIGRLGFPAEAAAQIQAPSFSKHSLLNGLEVFFLDRLDQQAHYLLMVKNGAAFDPTGKWGATYLMAQMLRNQTARRKPDLLEQDLEVLGASVEVRVDWDALFLGGIVPERRLPDLLNVLGEMILKPAFTEENFARAKELLLQRISRQAESAASRTQQLFLGRLFGNNPYGHPVEGTAETVKALRLNDVRIQYRRLLMPNQAQLAVEFSGDRARLLKGIGRAWGSWVQRKAAPFTFRQASGPRQPSILLLDHAGDTALLRYGTLALRRGVSGYYALALLKQYLQLMLPDWAEEIAGKDQIQASVDLQARTMPGYLQLSIQAPAQQIPPYLRKIQDALQQVQQGRIDPQRYREAGELALLELRNRLRDPRTRLFELLSANLYNLGVSYLTNYGLRLQRVKPAHLKSTLGRLFPAGSFLAVVAGPASLLRPQLETLGPVTVLN